MPRRIKLPVRLSTTIYCRCQWNQTLAVRSSTRVYFRCQWNQTASTVEYQSIAVVSGIKLPVRSSTRVLPLSVESNCQYGRVPQSIAVVSGIKLPVRSSTRVYFRCQWNQTASTVEYQSLFPLSVESNCQYGRVPESIAVVSGIKLPVRSSTRVYCRCQRNQTASTVEYQSLLPLSVESNCQYGRVPESIAVFSGIKLPVRPSTSLFPFSVESNCQYGRVPESISVVSGIKLPVRSSTRVYFRFQWNQTASTVEYQSLFPFSVESNCQYGRVPESISVVSGIKLPVRSSTRVYCHCQWNQTGSTVEYQSLFPLSVESNWQYG